MELNDLEKIKTELAELKQNDPAKYLEVTEQLNSILEELNQAIEASLAQ